MVADAYPPQLATPSTAYAWTPLGVLIKFFLHGDLLPLFFSAVCEMTIANSCCK